MDGHLCQNYESIYKRTKKARIYALQTSIKITIKLEEQGKRGRWKAIKMWECKTRVNGGKEYKASRLGGLERVRGGEKVIISRARERKEEKPICSSRLSRSCFTLSHELLSRVWPVGRSFLPESIVVSVTIRISMLNRGSWLKEWKTNSLLVSYCTYPLVSDLSGE